MHAVRIQRGWFHVTMDEDGCFEDDGDPNVKYENWLCVDCFLKDEDLCKFFNKNGDNFR